ncbi:unnamed protein product [Rotaria socialis]|uniref:Uncharacterized protein n=1 Tax=Rotaria socialis TaxID=392032 RepID=A0A820YLT2_9BILA|nr:unnamed protein product [Rotaria socialis]
MCRPKDNQNLALPDLVRIDHIISQNIQLQERVNRLEIREVAHNLVRIELQRENMELRAELRERIMLPDLVVFQLTNESGDESTVKSISIASPPVAKTAEEFFN